MTHRAPGAPPAVPRHAPPTMPRHAPPTMPHIVDTLIEERAGRLMRHPALWRMLWATLRPLLGYRAAIEMADAIMAMTGEEVLRYLSTSLALDVRVHGLGNVPSSGRAIVAPNHPTGIADGVAVFDALKERRTDITFFANRDAIRVSPGMADTIIPVEWVEARRTRARNRETLRATIEAFRRERLVVIFPSGRLARPSLHGLRERPWQTTAVNLARKFGAPVIPMHILARNSLLFYGFWLLHEELRDITLFRELLNKEARVYDVSIGPAFDPTDDAQASTEALCRLVTGRMRAEARAGR